MLRLRSAPLSFAAILSLLFIKLNRQFFMLLSAVSQRCALTATFFCLATKERKSALYVAHCATEIDLMFCRDTRWNAHHSFVCEAHPTATYSDHFFFTRNQ